MSCTQCHSPHHTIQEHPIPQDVEEKIIAWIEKTESKMISKTGLLRRSHMMSGKLNQILCEMITNGDIEVVQPICKGHERGILIRRAI